MSHTITWSPHLITISFQGRLTGDDIIEVLHALWKDPRYSHQLHQLWNCYRVEHLDLDWDAMKTIDAMIDQQGGNQSLGRIAIIAGGDLVASLAFYAMIRSQSRPRRVFRSFSIARSWLGLENQPGYTKKDALDGEPSQDYPSV